MLILIFFDSLIGFLYRVRIPFLPICAMVFLIRPAPRSGGRSAASTYGVAALYRIVNCGPANVASRRF